MTPIESRLNALLSEARKHIAPDDDGPRAELLARIDAVLVSPVECPDCVLLRTAYLDEVERCVRWGRECFETGATVMRDQAARHYDPGFDGRIGEPDIAEAIRALPLPDRKDWC